MRISFQNQFEELPYEELYDIANWPLPPKHNPEPKETSLSPTQMELAENLKDADEQMRQEETASFSFLCDPTLLPAHNGLGRPLIVNTEKNQVDKFIIGISSTIGMRREMEDTHSTGVIEFDVSGVIKRFVLFGVYDGHGGSSTSKLLAEKMQTYIKRGLIKFNSDQVTEKGIVDGLKFACTEIDRIYKKSDGSTLAIAMIFEKTIYFANVGDSRIIFNTSRKITQCTEDAKPTISRYRSEIESKGGSVINHRVEGQLAIARVIGDWILPFVKHHTKIVSSTPQVTAIPLSNGYLTLFTDGLIEKGKSPEAKKITSLWIGKTVQELAQKDISPDAIATCLLNNALIKGKSQDNITVMVVKIDDGTPFVDPDAPRWEEIAREDASFELAKRVQNFWCM